MRLIDADDLLTAFPIDDEPMLTTSCVRMTIRRMPTIEERKRGKWTVGADMHPMRHRNGKPKKFCPSFRYCSECGHEAFDDSDWGEQLFDWCPYCGADMRGGSDGT